MWITDLFAPVETEVLKMIFENHKATLYLKKFSVLFFKKYYILLFCTPKLQQRLWLPTLPK